MSLSRKGRGLRQVGRLFAAEPARSKTCGSRNGTRLCDLTDRRRRVQAAPPAWCLTSSSTRRCCSTTARSDGRPWIGPVALIKGPIEAIDAIYVLATTGRLVVFRQHVLDDTLDSVGPDAYPPAKVTDSVESTRLPCMALTLESIAADGAGGKGRVASAHVYRIGSVAKVRDAGIGSTAMTTDVVARGSRQTEPTSSQGVGKGFKCNRRQTKCKTEERCDDATERMTRQPNFSIGI